jgi:FKBP-type peptidyl-prolyl cis-trans isomerase (trigger factor)
MTQMESTGSPKGLAPLMDAPISVSHLVPDVDPPHLERLILEVPQKASTDSGLLEWWAEKQMVQSASGHQRRFEEPLEFGDWVRINCLAFAGGLAVPFTARSGIFIDAELEVVYPGVLEAIYGARVGETVTVKTVMSADIPEQPRAGKGVVVVVEIVDAYGPLSQAEKSSGTFKAALKEAQLWSENQHNEAVQQSVLQALRDANPVPMDPASIGTYIHYMWANAEGPALKRMGIFDRDMRHLLNAWQRSPSIQGVAQEQIANTALIRAYGRSRGTELSKEDVANHLKSVFKLEGMALYQAADDALADTRRAKESMHGLWYLAVLRALVSEVLSN